MYILGEELEETEGLTWENKIWSCLPSTRRKSFNKINIPFYSVETSTVYLANAVYLRNGDLPESTEQSGVCSTAQAQLPVQVHATLLSKSAEHWSLLYILKVNQQAYSSTRSDTGHGEKQLYVWHYSCRSNHTKTNEYCACLMPITGSVHDICWALYSCFVKCTAQLAYASLHAQCQIRWEGMPGGTL